MARNIEYNFDIQGNGLQTLGQMEDNLSALNEEIRGVDRNSDAFVELSGKIQQANTQLAKANSEIEGFTEERRVKALQGSIDIFTGLLETSTGLATQLGLNNEEFEKVVENLIAVQSTANGIRTVFNGIKDLREATRGLTTAQLGFNTAALANPYVRAASVIVVAITSIVTQFDRFKEAIGDVGVSLPNFEGAFDKIKAVVRGAAAFIATQLGVITKGFVQLFSADFSGAFESFRDALTFDSASTAAVDEYSTTPTEPDDEVIMENAKKVGAAGIKGVAQGVIEQTEDLDTLEAAALRALGVPDELLPEEEFDPDSVEVIDEEQFERDNDYTEQVQANEDKKTKARQESNKQLIDGFALTADLAAQAATLAPQNKALAKAAIIGNAAVGAIGIWRDYHGEKNTIPAPFNTIAAIATTGILAASTVSALNSLNSDTPVPNGSPTPAFSGPTVSTPRAADVQQVDNALQEEINASQDTTVVAVLAEGDIRNSTERSARAQKKRRFGG